MKKLFQPLQLGALLIPNRIIMAPLTRTRASAGRVPNALMAKYYAQRASAGLIISEATAVDPMGVGYPNTPGIWSAEQVEGWKLITSAVHQAGGRIYMQLWHVGRISDPIYLDGKLPVAPSAITPIGNVSLVRPTKPFVTPRALELSEIPDIIEAYKKGAKNALESGFDGVEIHGANGYLLDQFLQDSTNHREDCYGGSIENRARLMLEVTDAVISVWGANRVGMHIAPRADTHSMGDSNRLATFTYLVEQLNQRKIAFICAREAVKEDSIGPILRKSFHGIYIMNEAMDQEVAERILLESYADAVAFGKAYIANPDLVTRFLENSPLNAPDASTFYGDGEKGYTDYPTLAEGN